MNPEARFVGVLTVAVRGEAEPLGIISFRAGIL
jgi:hypothetical protein